MDNMFKVVRDWEDENDELLGVEVLSSIIENVQKSSQPTTANLNTSFNSTDFRLYLIITGFGTNTNCTKKLKFS